MPATCPSAALHPPLTAFIRPTLQEEMSKMAKGRGGPSVASLNNVLMQVR